MRLHVLELTGFGPFRETQRVDFDAFADDGLFLITGRTGAGKSSILDGVSFALYGTVPRYEGADRRLRSDHSALTDPTEVRLEFTVGDVRWRVTRAPDYDRPAKRGGGLTTEPARAELEERVGDAWIGRAAGPRDVGLALGELLGLGAQQFQQVILLAQNKFSRFLLAPGDERQTLLRALFGTRRFEQYRDELEQRRRDAQKRLDAAGEHARTLLEVAERLVAEAADARMPAAGDPRTSAARAGDFAAGDPRIGASGAGDLRTSAARAGDSAAGDPGIGASHDGDSRTDAPADGASHDGDPRTGAPADGGPAPAPVDVRVRRDALLAAVVRADYHVEQALTERAQADLAHRAAADAHVALADRAQRGRERARAREHLAQLEDRAPEMDAARERRDLARTANLLRAPLEGADRAVAAARAAADEVAAATAAWIAEGGSADVDASARIDELTAELARATDAAALERAQEGVRTRRAGLEAARAEADAAIADLEARREALPAARADLDTRIDAARTAAARLDDLRRRTAELSGRRDAAQQAIGWAETCASTEAAHLAASAAAGAAATRVTALLQRRLAGFAGELSAALADGEPCAVCGSLAHPQPAAPTADPVTDADLAAAETERERTAQAAAVAADAARDARERRADALARAAGHDVAAADAALAVLHDETAAAESAARDAERLLIERAALDDRAAVAEAERARLHDRRAVLAEELAAVRADEERAEGVIVQARAAFPSVAARIAAGDAERARARRLQDARDRLRETEGARDAATADLDARVLASPFDTARAARAALRPDVELVEVDEVLAAHAADVAATRSRLLDLELAVIGDDVTDDDLAASTAAVAGADARRSAAIADVRDAELAARRLRDLVQQADAAFAGVEDLADDTAVVTRLADTVAGRAPNTMKMDLETFVLAAELEEIVAAANVRLSEMSSGRYTLRHTDARAARGRASGLGLEVLDAHTGRLRSPQSLSGGETFLASLALALGLGEVVTSRAGGIRLDTLFVDEGFGSLDPETLELAMRTLDELRAGGRIVGVISHVEAMKEQLPAQLVVEATPEGPSVILQDVVAA